MAAKGLARSLGWFGLGLGTATVAGVAARSIARRAKATAREPATVNTIQTVAVNRSPEECYRFWRNFENLAHFMQHVQEVQTFDDRLSHWVVKGPAGVTVEWDAELVEDQPAKEIAWRSLDGADVKNSGWVRFEQGPTGHGTFVKAQITYESPGGKLGTLAAKLIGKEPGQLVNGDLRRFKHILEAGEIPTTDGQPHGPRSKLGRLAEAFDRA